MQAVPLVGRARPTPRHAPIAASAARASCILRVAILLAVPALATVVSRGFCGVLCPPGAISSISNRWEEHRHRLNAIGDTPVRLDVGPPLTASVSAEEMDDDQVSLGLTIVGRSGAEHTISCDGRDNPPGFEMVDATGKVVLTGDFEYG